MKNENRASRRFVFAKDSEIRAVLVPVEGGGQVDVKILNISHGGLGMAAGKNNREKLVGERQLFLQSITDGTGLASLKGQTIEIKWVLHYEPLENLGVGCEFVNIDEDCIEEIDALFLNIDNEPDSNN